MIAAYSEAHRRLNHVLELFCISCVAGIFIGVIHNDRWFATIWLLAGIITGVIAASPSRSAAMASAAERAPEKKDLADELALDDEHVLSELADERAFDGKFLKFTALLAVTVLASGFALGNSWWVNLIAGTIAWFASMFGIALLCAPRKNGEGDVVD